jgi:hypothetical protein
MDNQRPLESNSFRFDSVGNDFDAVKPQFSSATGSIPIRKGIMNSPGYPLDSLWYRFALKEYDQHFALKMTKTARLFLEALSAVVARKEGEIVLPGLCVWLRLVGFAEQRPPNEGTYLALKTRIVPRQAFRRYRRTQLKCHLYWPLCCMIRPADVAGK